MNVGEWVDDTTDEFGILLLDPKDPLATAEKFIERWHMVDGVRTLHRHRGDYFEWACFHPLPPRRR